jgi:hypothetical protein
MDAVLELFQGYIRLMREYTELYFENLRLSKEVEELKKRKDWWMGSGVYKNLYRVPGFFQKIIIYF